MFGLPDQTFPKLYSERNIPHGRISENQPPPPPWLCSITERRKYQTRMPFAVANQLHANPARDYSSNQRNAEGILYTRTLEECILHASPSKINRRNVRAPEQVSLPAAKLCSGWVIASSLSTHWHPQNQTTQCLPLPLYCNIF